MPVTSLTLSATLFIMLEAPSLMFSQPWAAVSLMFSMVDLWGYIPTVSLTYFFPSSNFFSAVYLASIAPSLTYRAPYLMSCLTYWAFCSVSGDISPWIFYEATSYIPLETYLRSYQLCERVDVTFSIIPFVYFFTSFFPSSIFCTALSFSYFAPYFMFYFAS